MFPSARLDLLKFCLLMLDPTVFLSIDTVDFSPPPAIQHTLIPFYNDEREALTVTITSTSCRITRHKKIQKQENIRKNCFGPMPAISALFKTIFWRWVFSSVAGQGD